MTDSDRSDKQAHEAIKLMRLMMEGAFASAIKAVVQQEREACAALAESLEVELNGWADSFKDGSEAAKRQIAAAIRARGSSEPA